MRIGRIWRLNLVNILPIFWRKRTLNLFLKISKITFLNIWRKSRRNFK